jgi:nucleoside-diphosphate-sugar epimerase
MVIHLAALTGVRNSFDKQEEYYDVNVNGSKAVFYACRRNNVPVIYTSSSNAEEWWTNPYAVTKKIMEEVAPKNSLGVRPHTIYPGRKDMLYWKLENTPEKIGYINGTHTRDYTHIKDFCAGLFTLIENYDIIDYKIVDIGTGNPIRVLDLADSFGWEGLIRLSNTPKERKDTMADTTLLTELGWKPKHKII